MLDKVKIALRITHNFLDSEILDTIKVAKAEMVRAGVSADVAYNEGNELVAMAIKTYCLYVYSNDIKMAEGYFHSWEYQLDNMRKSTYFRQEG